MKKTNKPISGAKEIEIFRKSLIQKPVNYPQIAFRLTQPLYQILCVK